MNVGLGYHSLWPLISIGRDADTLPHVRVLGVLAT